MGVLFMENSRENATGNSGFDDLKGHGVPGENANMRSVKKGGDPSSSGTAGFHCSLRYLLTSLLVIAVTVSLGIVFAGNSMKTVQVSATQSLPVIVIDAGHGGEDCGTVSADGTLEKDLNLAVSQRLASLFRAAGYPVVMTRTDDRLLYTEEQNIKGQRKQYDLKNRLLISEKYENGILISIHMNSFPSPKYGGTQIWYADDDFSRKLAQGIQAEIVRTLQPDNHRHVMKSTQDLYLLSRSTHCALLIECGFLSNEAECSRLRNEEYQKRLSFAIFYAMIKELNAECAQEYET